MSSMSETLASVCPLDCPDTCSLSVTVDDGRITRVRGSHANPYTAGVICEKVAKYYPDFVHGPKRLDRALIRNGERGTGNYRQATFADALDIIHERVSDVVARHGGQSVMPLNYAGPHGKLANGSMDLRFFNRLGATRLDRGPLCGAVRGAAYTSLFGVVPGMPPEQAEEAELIAIWGNNVTVSNLHFARVVQRARKRGAKVAVIDPRRIRIAEQADLHVQIRPGTDVVLAMALAAEMERRERIDHDFIKHKVSGFDPYMAAARQYSLDDAARICGVDRSSINALADLYENNRGIALSIGNGMERSRNGGSSLRAIISLSVLCGALDKPGAGVMAKHSANFPFNDDRLSRSDLGKKPTRIINIVDSAKHLLEDDLDPPIRAVFIYNHNPVCTHPDQNRMRQALSREEIFIVGIDIAMTDSMHYADVILPAASHFEFADVYGAYGQTWLQRADAVIPTVGEALPNTEIFRQLAQRFGFDDDAFNDDDNALIRAAVDAGDPRLNGLSGDQLPLDRAIEMSGSDGIEPAPATRVTPATPSGRIELFSADLEERFGCGIPLFTPIENTAPLNLISPSSNRRTNSTFGGHTDSQQAEILEINPRDAASRNIDDGDRLLVFNNLGRVELIARISDRVAPGVIYSPKGTWLATSATGQTVNALISASARADIMGGACFNDTFVEVERINN